MFMEFLFIVSQGLDPAELPESRMTGHDLANLLIYAVGAMAFAQLLWISAMGRLGIAVAPFYVMLFLLALGEEWDWRQAVGAAVIALGVVIAQQRPNVREARI